MNEKAIALGLVGLLVLLNFLSYLYVSFASIIFLVSFVLFASILFFYRKKFSGLKIGRKAVEIISLVVVYTLLFVKLYLIPKFADFFRQYAWWADLSYLLLILDASLPLILGILGFIFLFKKQVNMEKLKSEHVLVFVLLILVLPFAIMNLFNFIAFTAAPNLIQQFQFLRAIGLYRNTDISSLISFLAIMILFNHFSNKIEYKSLLILLFSIGLVASINDYVSICSVSDCTEFTSFNFEPTLIATIIIKVLSKPLLFVGIAFITFLVSNKIMKKSDASSREVSEKTAESMRSIR